MGPPQGHKYCRKPAPAWGPLSMKPHILPRACCSVESSLHRAWQEPAPNSSLLQCGVLHRLQVEICSIMALHTLQRNFCFSTCCISSPFFCTDLGALPSSVMRLALDRSGSVLEPAGTSSIQHGKSFWHVLTEATPHLQPSYCHSLAT